MKMKQKIKNFIKRYKVLNSLAQNILNALGRRDKSDFYKNFLSNIVEGSLKVKLDNIPGVFSIDARSHILKRILLSKKYEPEIVDQITKNIDTNKDAINIGANIGLFTNLIAFNINDQCRVLAIEPTPNAFKLLQSNIEINGNIGKTILFNGIATDISGEYEINTIPGNEEYSSIGEMVHPAIKNREFVKIKVKGETVDNLVEKYNLNPGIIVIDVEGAEYSVLKGSIETIKKYKPIIISEIVDDFLVEQNCNSMQILDFFKQMNYVVTSANNESLSFPFTGNIIAKSKNI